MGSDQTPHAPALTVRDLVVTGEGKRQILHIDALDIPSGQQVGIRGPSGAGKSTLLNALAGLADGATGTVCWGDTDLISLTDTARTAFRAKHIGMIFQDFLLFDELSAEANASIAALYAPKPARSTITANATAALAARNVPATDRTVSSYSGGERQRVAVARALAHDPCILLADEPTASLDPASADAMINDLTSLARAGSQTLIVVSHDERLLARMDRVLTITGGALLSAAEDA